MMPRKGRKHCPSLALDFLSNLPDNIIDVILMRLPFKDTVRTSILSTKWRYKWCRLTELTLDTSVWKTMRDLRDPRGDRFTRIIYQILTLHDGPITKFTLGIDFNLESCPEIDNLIYFISRKDIQHLVLHFPWCTDRHQLPSSLFTCSQLKHLALRRCMIRLPSTYKGFDRLTSLELCYVTISSESLEYLISHCPLLDQLLLKKLKTSHTVEINSPMLRSFHFDGKLTSICLKNVPLLAKVSVLIRDNGDLNTCDLSKFFESCSSLEHLLMELYDIKLYMDEAATWLPFELNSVKRFYLDGLLLEESYIARPLGLIGSFPYLEFLEIKVYNEDVKSIKSLELKHFAGVIFNHLREVKIKFFIGILSEIQLAKLFLAKSPALVRMLIGWVFDERRGLKVLAKLSKCRRASPNVAVELVYELDEEKELELY